VCSYVVMEETADVMVIPDLHLDERFNSWVTESLRFYAGCAIVVEGYKIGSLCIIDAVARTDFDAKQQDILRGIGAAVSQLLTLQYYNEERLRNFKPEQLATNIVYGVKQPLRIVEQLNVMLQRKYERVRGKRHGRSPVNGKGVLGPDYQKCLSHLRASLSELGEIIETSLNYAHTKQMEKCMLLPHITALQGSLQRLLVLPEVVRELRWQLNDFPADPSTLLYTYPYALRQVLSSVVFNLSLQWECLSVDITYYPNRKVTRTTPRAVPLRLKSTSTDDEAAKLGLLFIILTARGRKEVAPRGAHRIYNEFEVGLSVVADIVRSAHGSFTSQSSILDKYRGSFSTSDDKTDVEGLQSFDSALTSSQSEDYYVVPLSIVCKPVVEPRQEEVVLNIEFPCYLVSEGSI